MTAFDDPESPKVTLKPLLFCFQVFCLNKWGSGQAEPDPEYVSRFEKMMQKFGPLPEGWKEMYDPGVGRHFFWCTR